MSMLVLAISRCPEPVLVTTLVALNALLPLLLSLDVPVLVALTVPLKVHPLKNSPGLEEVRGPLNVDAGPYWITALPVSVMFCAVAPDCVKLRSTRVPDANVPAVIVLPPVSVASPVPLPKYTPAPPTFWTVMELLNCVPIPFWLEKIQRPVAPGWLLNDTG